MKIAVNSILSLLDVGTGFCYWLLGRDLLEDEVKHIENLFIKVQKPDDELILIQELNILPPGKDLLLVCDRKSHNLVQWCIINNYRKALYVLLEYGCNPNRTGLSGYDLPLALACCLGHSDMIQLLLHYGANPSEQTMLSNDLLKYLSQKKHKEHYQQLFDLIKYRSCISSLCIVLTYDNLTMFRLLMGETDHLPTTSNSLITTIATSSINVTHSYDDSNVKINETDFDIYREKLKIENYVENIISNDNEECIEPQQIQNQPHPHQQQSNIIINDNLSDYAELAEFFSFCDNVDVQSAVVNCDDGIQALSEKGGNQIERINEEETFVPGATTDGGYYTVDGSSGRVKSQPAIATVDGQTLREIHIEESIKNVCTTITEQTDSNAQRSQIISRTKSQQYLTKLSTCNNTNHRHSLPVNTCDSLIDQSSKRCRSTSSFISPNMSNSTKQTAHLLRLLHQMIEREAATILEYFLNIHRDEFNDHFHTAANSSDIQLKTYELLSNIKSDRIYNVLLSSNCAYFNRITTSLCDKENNTLVHTLLRQNPLKYQPEEMIKIVSRYLSCGLKEFINRPNLSNHCMIQILLCNEHFLKIIFFLQTPQSLSNYINTSSDSFPLFEPIYDMKIIEKWRKAYLTLIETLLTHGARIDIPAGSYRNSLDCLLSTLIDLAKRFTSLKTIFDMKYLRHLISMLISSFHQTKNRSIYFKYNLERFIHLLYSIHVNNEDLSDILSIVHLLLQYEYQPLKLNASTLMQLFKLWLTNPNFLCSSLIGKDLFMQQFLMIIVHRLGFISQSNNQLIDTPLLISTGNNLPRKSSLTLNDNELCLQNLFLILLNLISLSQTCLQIHSIYELILIFINHTTIDILNNDLSQLPIVFLCSQTKITKYVLLIRFIDLFTMTHSPLMINKTDDTLSQISTKRLSIELYQHFLSINKLKKSVRSLRHISTKYIYHHIKKPFITNVTSLPIGDTLKKRLIQFHDI